MDVSKLLTIDNDLRTITIPPSIEHMGVESDDDVLRLYFAMPRMYNDIDLSDFVVRINYQNANGEIDVYLVDDNAAGADEITFSWNIRRKVVAYRGKVRFIVCLKRLDDQGNVLQEFNSSVAALPVLRGLEATESHMEDEYPDIMEQILLRLDKLEQGGTGADCHITYVESPDADGNLVRLRDLESGTYILYGRFICYSIPDAETKLITFGWRFPVVIGRTEAKTYLQCIYPPQNTMQYAEITDTSFERKDVRLLYSPNSNANAEIGQTLVVSAVDDNGKPTDWEYSTPGESTTVNGAVVSSGSDYAVCFAWHDGNPDKEDRKNRFVQLADGGNKITFATSGADICGVTTDTAAFVENYDIASDYTSLVGILGVVTVIDNGSCTVGETCMSDDNGYAVPSTNNMGYRVTERLDETRIRIAVKPNDDMIQRIKRDMDNKLDFSKAQELSDAEKTQARDNIDAASKEDISSLSGKMLTEDDLGEALAQAKESGEFDGQDGVTPTIGENGNWFLGETDTGKPSRGEDGHDGDDGHTPVKGTDYWTADDKQSIVDDVMAALPTWDGGSY